MINKEKRDKAVAFMEKMLEKVKKGEAQVSMPGEDCACHSEEHAHEEELDDDKSQPSEEEAKEVKEEEEEEERKPEEDSGSDEEDEGLDDDESSVTLSREDVKKILSLLGL